MIYAVVLYRNEADVRATTSVSWTKSNYRAVAVMVVAVGRCVAERVCERSVSGWMVGADDRDVFSDSLWWCMQLGKEALLVVGSGLRE